MESKLGLSGVKGERVLSLLPTLALGGVGEEPSRLPQRNDAAGAANVASAAVIRLLTVCF